MIGSFLDAPLKPIDDDKMTMSDINNSINL